MQPRHSNNVLLALIQRPVPLRSEDDHLVPVAPGIFQVTGPMVPLVPYEDIANRESVLFDDGTEALVRVTLKLYGRCRGKSIAVTDMKEG